MCALLYALIVAGHDIPALRQDWAWPTGPDSLASLFSHSTSGWDARGIGAPNLHLNDYIIGTITYLIALVVGSHFALVVFAFLVGLSCALGASSLAGVLGARPTTCAGLAFFATFNPFVYTETVAGHTYMLLAYGATMALLAQAQRPKPQPFIASLLAAVTLAQLQFFVPALIVVTLMGLRRKVWLPLATALIVSAPIVVAVGAEYEAFRAVPTTIAWEKSQSVPFALGSLLNGYFAGYGQSIHALDKWPMRALVALAVLGGVTMWRNPAAKLALAAAALSLAAAAGLQGPLAPALAWMFAHAPAAGLYRELYDLVGFTAISYIFGVALADLRFGFVGPIVVVASIALTLAWLGRSPWEWWVPASAIPEVRIEAPADTRFALLPAFQPLTLLDRGSGLDPDAYPRLSAQPLNTQTPSYPIDAALAHYARSGDTKPLTALGVSTIVERPWLASDAVALSFQRALAIAPRAKRPTRLQRFARIDAQPLVAMLPTPRVGDIDNVLGAGAVMFADVAGLRDNGVPATWFRFRPLVAVRPSNKFVRAGDGWVDARLAFSTYPQLAQAFGGAVTTSRDDLLALEPRTPALVFVDGSLVAQNGRLVSGATSGYRWVPIPQSVTAVRCSGLCVVAAQGFPPAGLPGTPRAAKSTVLEFRVLLPWLIEARLPSGSAGALRLNEAYDRNWLARADGLQPAHVRLDASVNAWILPERATTTQVWIVQWPAALELVLELIAGAWIAGLLVVMVRRRAGSQIR